MRLWRPQAGRRSSVTLQVTPGVQVSVVEAHDVIGKGGALLAANSDASFTNVIVE